MAENNISDNAKKAEEIKNKMPKEVRLAAEAMQRTTTARRTSAFFPKKYNYQQILGQKI